MAENTYPNKIVYGNQVLIDLTNDTVNASNLLSGIVAHAADGSTITGTMETTYHITLHQSQYDQLTTEQKNLTNTWYYIDDATNASVAINDNVISDTKAWSSLKTNAELQAVVDTIATQYDSEETYNIGDICANGNQVYICNTDNTTGTWDNTKWVERNVAELIISLNNKIDGLREYVEITKETSSETRGNLLRRLYSAIDRTKITDKARLVFIAGTQIFAE